MLDVSRRRQPPDIAASRTYVAECGAVQGTGLRNPVADATGSRAMPPSDERQASGRRELAHHGPLHQARPGRVAPLHVRAAQPTRPQLNHLE